MEEKLLSFNLKNSNFILIRNKNVRKALDRELENNSLILCGQVMKEAKSLKYLGELEPWFGLFGPPNKPEKDWIGQTSIIQNKNNFGRHKSIKIRWNQHSIYHLGCSNPSDGFSQCRDVHKHKKEDAESIEEPLQ